jgi:hypothetical protein
MQERRDRRDCGRGKAWEGTSVDGRERMMMPSAGTTAAGSLLAREDMSTTHNRVRYISYWPSKEIRAGLKGHVGKQALCRLPQKNAAIHHRGK